MTFLTEPAVDPGPSGSIHLTIDDGTHTWGGTIERLPLEGDELFADRVAEIVGRTILHASNNPQILPLEQEPTE